MRHLCGIHIISQVLDWNIEAIERVQKFALKMCLKSWSSNYEQLLLEAKLPTLKVRRSELSLGHLYKIINKLTYYPEPPIIQRKIHYRNRGINANTVCIPHATTTAYQQSFYPKTLRVCVEFATWRSDKLY